MRVGILGGTFDPIHYGHLLIAESAREQLLLDQVRFVPAGDPPHKPGVPVTAARSRVEMLRLAIAGCPALTVDVRELDRPGPTFTVDTLQSIADDEPEAELFFLMGADSLRDFLTWKHPDRIATLARLVVCNRRGIAMPTSDQIIAWVGRDIASRVLTVTMPGVDLSATELRERIRSGRSIRFLTPRAVEQYIRETRLYETPILNAT